MGLLTAPLAGGGGGGGRRNFILIEVSSANCSHKDRCFASSCVKALCFIFFQKKVMQTESFQNPIVPKTAAGR